MSEIPLGALQALIEQRAIATVFQPVVDLQAQRVLGYEAASRGPARGPLHSPLTLFDHASRAGLLVALDRLCNEAACARFEALEVPGLLFVNCSPPSFVAAGARGAEAEAALGLVGLRPERVVIEVTEQQPVDDFAAMRAAADVFHRLGYHIAVDDLGAGYAGLRFWTELRPDYVKIDRHFIENIDADASKRDFVRSIVEIGRGLGCRVVAEGIETEDELAMVQDLGIEFGQGFLLGVPRPAPATIVPSVLRRRPRARTRARLFADTLAGDLAQPAATEPSSMPAEQVLERFLADRHVLALPVVDAGT
jgi:EAL domain-containing protein (putative c-di-GMP-specific phosphodiesterase class I)